MRKSRKAFKQCFVRLNLKQRNKMTYLQDLEKVTSEEELDQLIQKQATQHLRVPVTNDMGSIMSIMAFGIDETKQAAHEGLDAEIEIRIDFP
jgi:hypothetical protein